MTPRNERRAQPGEAERVEPSEGSNLQMSTNSIPPTVTFTGADGQIITGQLVQVTDYAVAISAGALEPVACWTGGEFSLERAAS